jgi:hypothetical protein
MEVINSLARVIAGQIVRPVAGLPAVVGLAGASAVLALVLLVVFRATSDQGRLARAKRRVQAGLFELRLFREDPMTILSVQRDLLAAQGEYLRSSIFPLLVASPILAAAAGHVQAYFGFAPLVPGQPIVVSAILASTSAPSRRPAIELRVPDGLQAGPAVWSPGLRRLTWVVRAARPGAFVLRFAQDGREDEKRLVVGPGVRARSPVRAHPGLFTQVLYPAEPPLPANGSIARIEVDYRDASVDVFRWRMHWAVVFVALIVASIIVLRRPLKVVI